MLYYDFIINLKLDLKFVKIGYYIVLALFSVPVVWYTQSKQLKS